MFRLPCPGCGRQLEVNEEWRGRTIRCSQCGRECMAAPDAAQSDSHAESEEPTANSPSFFADVAPKANADATMNKSEQPHAATVNLPRIDGFQIIEVLGRGGMGVVYSAREENLDRLVALKVLNQEAADSDSARGRFVREAKTMAALDHDHVVGIYQVGEFGDVPFLTMPLLQGETLEQRLERKPKLPLETVLQIGWQTADGLAEAHKHGLIHRDIKPGNIFLEHRRASSLACPESELQPGAMKVANAGSNKAACRTPVGASKAACPIGERVKILDFGLARMTDGNTEITQEGALLGTPAYLSPEQAAGEKADARSDLFSLGCVLYRACTGERPFSGATTLALLAAVGGQHPKPPHEIDSQIPQKLSEFIMQMLAKDPAQRPASAQAVADTLYDMAADDTQAMTPPAGMPVLTLEPKTAATKTRRRWWLPVAFGVALTAVAGALLWNFGGFDFTWRTPHGTLYLTVEETGVEVFIDGVKKMILDTKTHGKIELTPGPRQLAVKRDGKTLYIESFTIKSNGKKAIQARWIPKTPPDNGKKPPVTASVLDGLDPAKIPAHERFPWQPENLVAVLGTHRQSHEWYVHRVAYLHNGEIIASASDAWLRLWDSKTMNLIAEKNESTLFLAVAPDGKGMACRDRDGVQIWTLSEDRKKLNKGPLLRHDAPVIAAASSPARNLMATVTFDSKSGAQIYVWDMKGPVQIAGREAAQTKKVRTIDFSRDGMLLATGDEMQRMQLWRFDDDKKRLQQVKNCHQMHKNGPVVSIAFNPDSKFLASIERIKYNGSVHLWRFDGTVLTAIKAPQELKADDFVTAAFSPTSDLLALAMGRRRIQLWEIQNGKPKKIADTLGKGFGQIQSMDFSPDGNHLVTASTTGMVRQWKIPRLNGKLEETMKAKAPIGPVDALAFLPGDREIVLGCYDGTLRVYDLTKPQPQEKTAWKAHSGYVTSVGYVPETTVLVSGAYKDRAKVWKMSGAVPPTKPLYSFPTPDVWSVGVSPTTPNQIALGHADGVVRFYNLSDLFKPEKWYRSKLDTHAQAGVNSWVTALEYSRDGLTLASSNIHGEPQIGICRLDGKAHARQPSIATEIGDSSTHPFAISPGGRKLYVANAYKIGVYELAKNGELTFVKNFALTGKNRINPFHLVCNKDALYIGDSHEIAEWKNNKIERRWKVPGIIRAMALSHDGRHLATAHYNGTVYILRVNLSP